MSDNNIDRTVVRKEDLHQEVGTIRHAENGNGNGNGNYGNGYTNGNGLKHVTEHNYHTTTIVRKEGMHESANRPTPDYSAPLPSYTGPAMSDITPTSFEKTNNGTHTEPKINNHQYNKEMDYTTLPHDNHTEAKSHATAHVPLSAIEDVSADKNSKGSASKFLKILTILGILVLLFFISIGIVKFVPKAIGSLSGASVYLSNLFSKDGIELVTDKKTMQSGGTLTVSWKNTSKETGLYTWSFACTEGITVLYRSTDGKMLPVICETSFPIPEAASSYPFVVNSTSDKAIKVSMTLALFNKETKELIYSDQAEVTVSKDAPIEVPTQPSNNTPTYNPGTAPATTTPPNPNVSATKPSNNTSTVPAQPISHVGPTDISIALVSANAIQSGTINLIPLTNVGPNDKVVLRFRIANLGQNQTGTWRLTASLPTRTIADQAYVSKFQPSLLPATSHEMTLMFDAFDASKNKISITIENSNDTNSANNIITIPISGTAGNTSGGSTTGSRPDFQVRILEVGIMDIYNNTFIKTNNIYSNNKVAVKFEVQNIGGTSTGYFDMRVDVPTEDEDSQLYRSLSPIAPGGKTEFTIGFDNPDTGNQTITVRIDPDNDIRENSESNNRASQSIYINR